MILRHVGLRNAYVSSRRALTTTAICNNEQNNVRVRFAPSPTGHIHLGGLRAALYNYIFAKQNNGLFVLRIEDTDRTRVVPGSAEEIEYVLNWAGLEPDESPSLGGPHEPYVQSERLKLYTDKAHELLEQGKAYRCFCSPARLELLRKYQSRNREKPHYDGKCRHLSPSEVKEKLSENNGEHVIRFALTEGDTIFNDLVFGAIKNNLVNSKESDPIILKSDKFPTYHFANVVDDKDMNITNVIRGAEWLSSTAKHIQIYQAFGWPVPQFLHFPLVTMGDGVKMSKRSNHSHVTEWIKAGYQPLALLNFLTNTGGGIPKEKQDSMNLWTLDEYIKRFDFKQLTSHPGSLDMNRLKIYNSKELQKAWSEDSDKVVNDIFELVKKNNIQVDIEEHFAENILDYLINRLETINDLLSPDYAFIWQHPKLSWSQKVYLDKDWNLEVIVKDTIVSILQVDIEDKEELTKSLKSLCARHHIDYGEYMEFLRKLLTNSDKGLPVHEIAQCLGKSRLLSYLENGLKYVESPD